MIIAERFHFYNRDQRENESNADYCDALRKASERCEFKTFLDEPLFDRFVCGLKSRNIQTKLSGERSNVEQGTRSYSGSGDGRTTSISKFGGSGMHVVNALKSRPRSSVFAAYIQV